MGGVKLPDNIWNRVVIVAAAGVGIMRLGYCIISYIQYRSLKASDRRPKVYDPGILYLHIFPREITRQMPNLSPYATKLETWLRMHNIKYQVVETVVPSPRTKQIPYIILNEREIPDSTAIIDYLTDTFDLDPSEGLTLEQRGVARAFHRMLDESTAWSIFIHTYVHKVKVFSRVYHPPIAKWLRNRFSRMLRQGFIARAKAQGMGRKTEAEVAKIGEDDICAISQYLGDKLFLMGDSPTSVDCTVFGHLSRIVYVDLPYPQKDKLDIEYTNIKPYLDRLKNMYWPDWDDIVTPGFFNWRFPRI